MTTSKNIVDWVVKHITDLKYKDVFVDMVDNKQNYILVSLVNIVRSTPMYDKSDTLNECRVTVFINNTNFIDGLEIAEDLFYKLHKTELKPNDLVSDIQAQSLNYVALNDVQWLFNIDLNITYMEGLNNGTNRKKFS